MASKRPRQTIDSFGNVKVGDENSGDNRPVKAKATGLSLRSHQPTTVRSCQNVNKKARARPAFEVFRDEEEPVAKKAAPVRIPLADITHSVNGTEKLKSSSSNVSPSLACKTETDTQDSGVEVVSFIASPEIECNVPDLKSEEDAPVTVPEPESSKKTDFQLNPIYFGDVFNYLREREESVLAQHDYMSRQTELTAGMRAMLVDWLSDVCIEYSINVASFFLTVSIVDRVLSGYDCRKNRLQLIGAGALFIATKIEEVCPPSLADLVSTTDDSFTKKQIVQAEKMILNHLKFDICAPCRYWFGTFFASKTEVSVEVDSLMRYFLELSLMSDQFLLYRASEVGIASLYLANQWINASGVIDEILDRANILKDDINPIMTKLADLFKMAPSGEIQSIYLKFACKSEHSVANLEVPPAFK